MATQPKSKSNVKHQPDNYHTVTAYLICSGAAAAIEFYKKYLGATEIMRMPAPDGRIGHAELKIGDSVVMLADEYPEMGARSPKTIGGTPVGLLLYVKDVDTVFNNAVAGGAKVDRAVADQFYGDRNGTIEDAWGHKWTLATHIEDVTLAEMKERMKAMKQ